VRLRARLWPESSPRVLQVLLGRRPDALPPRAKREEKSLLSRFVLLFSSSKWLSHEKTEKPKGPRTCPRALFAEALVLTTSLSLFLNSLRDAGVGTIYVCT